VEKTAFQVFAAKLFTPEKRNSSNIRTGSKVNLWRERMAKDMSDPKTEVMAETDDYMAWRAEEPDGETTYHLELNNVTLHFFREEWEEFLELVKMLNA
jgi:hypothetical protein